MTIETGVANIDKPDAHLATQCLICGETVDLTPEEESAVYNITGYRAIKVCDNCREAILTIRYLKTLTRDKGSIDVDDILRELHRIWMLEE